MSLWKASYGQKTDILTYISIIWAMAQDSLISRQTLRCHPEYEDRHGPMAGQSRISEKEFNENK
jgi:hypothetical protein